MSDTSSRFARSATQERDERAPRCRDDLDSATARAASHDSGVASAEIDCGEIVESGSGLGAFYAYQLALRSIERG